MEKYSYTLTGVINFTTITLVYFLPLYFGVNCFCDYNKSIRIIVFLWFNLDLSNYDIITYIFLYCSIITTVIFAVLYFDIWLSILCSC